MKKKKVTSKAKRTANRNPCRCGFCSAPVFVCVCVCCFCLLCKRPHVPPVTLPPPEASPKPQRRAQDMSHWQKGMHRAPTTCCRQTGSLSNPPPNDKLLPHFPSSTGGATTAFTATAIIWETQSWFRHGWQEFRAKQAGNFPPLTQFPGKSESVGAGGGAGGAAQRKTTQH